MRIWQAAALALVGKYLMMSSYHLDAVDLYARLSKWTCKLAQIAAGIESANRYPKFLFRERAPQLILAPRG